MELDKERLGDENKRGGEELRRIKIELIQMELGKERQKGGNKLTFNEILNRKPSLNHLIDLSFKSMVLLQALTKDEALFSCLAARIIF